MKFNLTDAPELPDTGVQVGDVYASKQNRVTWYWLIVAVRENSVVVLGLDKETGQITTGNNYAKYVFEGCCYTRGRILVGRCRDLNTSFAIDWFPPAPQPASEGK